MLEISVVEDPKRWKSWSFLGGEYLQAQRYDDAINAYKKALACPDADVGFLMMLIARVHQTKGDLASAVVEMEQAAFKAPTRELAVYTAELHFWNKNKDMAGWWLHRAQGIVNRSNGYSYDASCWDEAFDNRLKLYSA